MWVTADTPLFHHAPRATPEQCVRFLLKRAHGEYTAYDIAQIIVPAYYELCARTGLDPVLLIAQMIHETGCLSEWWAARPRRNPAGIGVTGQERPEKPAWGVWQWDARVGLWKEGLAFPTWREHAIPAHVGRVLAYALTDDQATSEQRALIDTALAYRPLDRYRGEAPTVRGFNGRWAVPGHTYADKLAEFANAICQQ